LNLLLSLRALHTSIIATDDIPNKRQISKTYTGAVELLASDHYLENLFGSSILANIAQIISQYPQVSEAELSVDQI
jgi:hypothetical protein